MSVFVRDNAQAFAEGFIDGFSNVGQVYEPKINGIIIMKEIRKPTRFHAFSTDRTKGKAFYRLIGPNKIVKRRSRNDRRAIAE